MTVSHKFWTASKVVPVTFECDDRQPTLGQEEAKDSAD